MTDSADVTSAIAIEVAKQIPLKDIYEDGVSPTMKQAGSIAEDIAKTLHLALAPIQYIAAIQDRYRNYLNTAVRRVPEKDRISPPPQILGPVVEAIKYEPDNSNISEMYSQLLSRAFDRNRVNEAHPSFPLIIRQLSEDEALIIKMIWEKHVSGGSYRRDVVFKTGGLGFIFDRVNFDELPLEGISYPQNLNIYMNHLWNLGLAGIFEYKAQTPGYAGGRQISTTEHREYRLTDFGQLLAKAVLPAD